MFTVGYEGRSPEAFVALLGKQKVRRVIDVRELPLSRRRGFSKTRLRELLESHGIEYVHLRSAGNPYRRMKAQLDECLRLYRSYIAESPAVLSELAALVRERPSALLCVEAEACHCHRSVLVENLQATNRRLEVRHL